MNVVTRAQRRQLERENAKRPAVLTEVPRSWLSVRLYADAHLRTVLERGSPCHQGFQ